MVLIDESGFLTTPLVRRTLAPRGKTPIIKQKGAHRGNVSVVAAMTVSPQRHRMSLFFKAQNKQAFDGARIAEFLRGVLRHLRGRVIVVWDNATIHKGDSIRQLLKKFPRLWLERLPPYAPHLNPVEQLWSWLKWSKLANFAPEDTTDILKRILPLLNASRRQHSRLYSFFKASYLPLPQRTLET